MENNNTKVGLSCILVSTSIDALSLSSSAPPSLNKKAEERELGVEEEREGENEEREGGGRKRVPLVESSPLPVTVLGEKIINNNKIPAASATSSLGLEKKIANVGNGGDGLSDALKKSTPPLPPQRRKKMVEESLIKRLTPPNPVKLPAMGLGAVTERYMSPTDSLMSPVSKGLLARNRRSMRPFPAYYVPPKILDNTFVEADAETSTEK